jgi:nucleotide-binding universal stress UspA family protein
MSLTDILIVLRPDGRDADALDLAASVAAGFRARLTALCVLPLPPMDTVDCYAVGAAAVSEVIERMDRETETAAKAALGPFLQVASRAGCESRWEQTAPGELAVETAMRARLSDLVVMRRPVKEDAHACRLAESFVRFGGAACLLLPHAARPPTRLDRIVIGWNASREAKRAVDDALPFLKAATSVEIVVAGEPAEAPAPSASGLAERLVRQGVVQPSVTQIDQGHDGRAPALLRHCAAQNADLLVMGAFGRTPRAEQFLGGTSWTAMTTAGLPLLFSR